MGVPAVEVPDYEEGAMAESTFSEACKLQLENWGVVMLLALEQDDSKFEVHSKQELCLPSLGMVRIGI
jgi:hypothetical protein